MLGELEGLVTRPDEPKGTQIPIIFWNNNVFS